MKIKQISPLEHNFTKKLDGIAVMPKMLYYYGVLPSSDNCSLPTAEPQKDGFSGRVADARLHGIGALSLTSEFRNPAKNTFNGSAVTCAMPRELPFGDSSGQVSAIPPRVEKLPLDEKPSLDNNYRQAIKSVAIVGARKNTPYGEEVAFRAAYELAKRGVVIVSGLAYGIDGIAHRGALAAGGITVGVLGTPIDRLYPSRNVGLANEMVEKGGAVISEYAPGAQLNYKLSFLERNRLIAGLADAVIVVEANVRSGSLNTATHALEQGRELFAVPGDINRPLSQGCNRLVAQGANPYTCAEDVLNFLFPEAEKKKNRKQMVLFGDNKDETALLQALAKGLKTGEEILAETGMEAAKYNQTVTILEIKGRIRSLGMNKWALT